MEPRLDAGLEAAWDWAMREAFAEQDQRGRLGADDTIGDFRIVREIGRGGMGVVYEAWQISLDRRVALKVLPYHVTLDEIAVARFRREATLAAQLHHRGIVDIHTVGCDAGTHYFAMEFLEGAPLDRVLELARLRDLRELSGAVLADVVGSVCHRPEGAPETGSEETPRPEAWQADHVRASVDLARQVAEALHHAHEAGVIHRDVKPANILVRRDGSAVLTDFGLASMAELPSLTICGQFTGTLHYVSPEQARPEHAPVDRRSDVFSLGVTLYEMLTLQLPFHGHTPQEILHRITERDPIDPRRLNPAIDHALSNVVLRALEKDPTRRYPTAEAFASDLRAWLAGAPVAARPAPIAVRCWRAVAHRRVGVVVTLAVALGLLGLASHWLRPGATPDERYWWDLERAQSALRVGDIQQARSVLAGCRQDLRDWEWRHLELRCRPVDVPANGPVVPLPVRGEHGVMCVAVGSDGRRVAAGSHDHMVRVWDLATGERLLLLAGHVGPVHRIAFHPDGVRVFSSGAEADCSVRMWNLDTASCGWVWRSGELEAGLACRPDGGVVAAGGPDGSILLLDADRGEIAGRIETDVGAIRALSFGPHGRLVAAGGAGGGIEVRDTEANVLVRAIEGHGPGIVQVAFHPDGRRLYAVYHDGTMRCWDLGSGELLGSVSSTSRVQSIALTPDGTRLVCGHEDASVRCHDAEQLELSVRIGDAGPGVLSMAFDAEGGRLVTASTYDGVRVFVAAAAAEPELRPMVERARRAWNVFLGLHRRFGGEPADAAWLAGIVELVERDPSLEPEVRRAVCLFAEETALRVAYRNLRSSHDVAIRARRSPADYAQALHRAELAWEVGPRTPEYALNVGMLLCRVGRARDALAWLDRADAANAAGPESFNPAWSMTFRAFCDLALGAPDSARTLLETVRALPAERRDYLVEAFLTEADARLRR